MLLHENECQIVRNDEQRRWLDAKQGCREETPGLRYATKQRPEHWFCVKFAEKSCDFAQESAEKG